MFATADHKASPETNAAFSTAVQFEAVSNQYLTVPPGVPDGDSVRSPHLVAYDFAGSYVAGFSAPAAFQEP